MINGNTFDVCVTRNVKLLQRMAMRSLRVAGPRTHVLIRIGDFGPEAVVLAFDGSVKLNHGKDYLPARSWLQEYKIRI